MKSFPTAFIVFLGYVSFKQVRGKWAAFYKGTKNEVVPEKLWDSKTQGILEMYKDFDKILLKTSVRSCK